VASELVKVFAREPSAQAGLAPILTSLIVSSCQELASLPVRGAAGELNQCPGCVLACSFEGEHGFEVVDV
jgi:hypothetical protein